MLRQSAVAIVTDVRFGLRMMGRSPVVTAVALLMIALGTGANAAMFSVIDAAMLRSPFVDADRLAMISVELSDGKVTAALTTDQYRSLVASPTPFDAIGAMGGGMRPTVTGLGELRKLNVECVTAGVFSVLGTPPLLGRTFTAVEDGRGSAGRRARYDYGSASSAAARTRSVAASPLNGAGRHHRRMPRASARCRATPRPGCRSVPRSVCRARGCTARGNFNAFAVAPAGDADARRLRRARRRHQPHSGLPRRRPKPARTAHRTHAYDFRTPAVDPHVSDLNPSDPGFVRKTS